MALTSALLHVVTYDSDGNPSYLPLPNPQTMTWSIQDVDSDSAGRSASGLMIRDRVSVKRKLTCTFAPAYRNQVAQLLQSVTSEFFYLRFPDAQTNSFRTMYCYVGDRSTEAYYLTTKAVYDDDGNVIDYVPGKWLWQAQSINFIER